eukprot:TRINITY_DN1400_c0_g1_i3.p1 TRINITY_DN1400_c0_g1~~TRINITY_DN1400_c0_g1_i3.p1  ORF type:complete len:204 (+),score=26.11 TRINITY_DN1400_c0_g1_i3:491-1102(+)
MLRHYKLEMTERYKNNPHQKHSFVDSKGRVRIPDEETFLNSDWRETYSSQEWSRIPEGEWPEAVVPASFNVYVPPSKLEIDENMPIFRTSVEEVMWGESGDENDDGEYRGDSDSDVVVVKSGSSKMASASASKSKKRPAPATRQTANKTVTPAPRSRKKTAPPPSKKTRTHKTVEEWRVVPTEPEFFPSGQRKNIIQFKLFQT